MKFEFSAGGIVHKRENNKILILVAQHSQHHGWVFPKGLIGPSTGSGQEKKETKEEAAVREVEEETGILGKIEKELPAVTYWYQFEGNPSTGSGQEKIKKTVYYFLMQYVSGDTKNHDHEMENVEWLDIHEVEKRLTYKSDKQVWQVALRAINRRLKAKK
ncbi:MAG: NUDIX domain-containing protein [Patescibacteria group bacterium]|nr:NUDIX domain-containing protein [Patescibacteria group bacterium]